MVKKAIILTFLFIFMLGTYALAHSGRTDSSGGHNCSESSKAKGLCSGYHYHNGGGPTAGGGSPSVAISDKDCSDFASYDEMVTYWNSKGYSAANDPENLDGWGNGQVDDGIPCEAPSGYDRTKINNSPEQLQYKQDQQDKAEGEQVGYQAGLSDGYAETNNKSGEASGSTAYKTGYKIGYEKGYEEGKNKITTEKTQATNEGAALGQTQYDLVVPEPYVNNPLLKKSFEDGFIKVVTERLQASGYEDGKKDLKNPPEGIDETLLKAYQDGYSKAQKELKQEYIKQGYDAAFVMLEYKKPGISNEKFVKWYKEGFESNKEVKDIISDAIELGKEGEPYKLPIKYKKSAVIFKHYYEEGYKDYEEKQSRTRTVVAGGIGTLALAWIGRRLYVAKKSS